MYYAWSLCGELHFYWYISNWLHASFIRLKLQGPLHYYYIMPKLRIMSVIVQNLSAIEMEEMCLYGFLQPIFGWGLVYIIVDEKWEFVALLSWH